MSPTETEEIEVAIASKSVAVTLAVTDPKSVETGVVAMFVLLYACQVWKLFY